MYHNHQTRRISIETGELFIDTQAAVPTSKQIDISSFQHYSDGISSANLSPFSTSPDESYSNGSCEDLRYAFGQANIKEEEKDHATPSSTKANTINIILIDMLCHFPDLPSFIHHKDFPVFSNIWIEFQKNTLLARDPNNRPHIQSWLETAALQIHYVMVTIVKTTTSANIAAHAESQPRRMFSALRRLKDRIEIMYQVFQIIEKGRVLFGQSPSVAIAPLVEAAIKIKRDVTYFASNHSQVIPVIGQGASINLMSVHEVTMSELSKGVMDTYNLMPYYNKSATTAANNLIVSSASLPSAAAANFGTPIIATSCQPARISDASLSITGTSPSTNAIHIQNGNHSRQNYISSANQNGSFMQPGTTATTITTTKEPMNQRVAPYSHIQPSWIHYATSASLPVTPSEHKQQEPFLSLPTTPTCTQEACSPAYNACTPCNTVRDLCGSPSYHQETSNNSSLNTLNEDNSEYEDQDEDMEIDIEELQDRDENNDNNMMEDDNEEYVASDNGQDEDWKEEKRSCSRRSSRRSTRQVTKRVTTSPQQLQNHSERHYTRRTATSYDAQTTHYLKSIFFDIYSSRDKLTKDQRRQVQKETGLKPRNITYWFSNHKRRFQNSLLVFKKTVKESKGAVKTFDDFLDWRKARGLPEEVLENEHSNLV